jgi:hypothetical protein
MTTKLIPIARMDREASNGTRPAERDSNAAAVALLPDLIDMARKMVAGQDMTWRAAALLTIIDARDVRPTEGPWVYCGGMVYAAREAE